jgi:hypothetical protein
MATTYELIDSVVLGSTTSTVTFSAIPQTFDDLLLLASIRGNRTSATTTQTTLVDIYPNGSSSNLSARWLYGDGSSASSVTNASHVYIFGASNSANWTADTFASVEVYIPNYAGSTNKSISATSAVENNNTGGLIAAIAGLWADTSAITSIELDPAYDFLSGCAFHLYGITKA